MAALRHKARSFSLELPTRNSYTQVQLRGVVHTIRTDTYIAENCLCKSSVPRNWLEIRGTF